jgi:ribosomal protein S18 acetylase RimI-like enzyme
VEPHGTTPVTPETLDRIEPLWVELHRHHRTVAPELAPFVGDGESWEVRSQIYRHLLAEGGTILVARDGGRDVGYLAFGRSVRHWTATLDTPDYVAELLTLVVVPEARGRGVGSELMRAFADRPAVVSVIPQNTRAVAFYERAGFRSEWLSMTRFGRSRTHAPVVHPWEPIGLDELDSFRPLWLQLHHHHRDVGAQLGPFLSDDASWDAMRGILEDDIREGLAFRIGPAGDPLAFIAGSVGRDSTIWGDTWVTSGPVAEPDVLVVAAGARGTGLGSALMDVYDDAVAERGASDQILGVFAPNTDAMRLYERRGFRPAWLEMFSPSSR